VNGCPERSYLSVRLDKDTVFFSYLYSPTILKQITMSSSKIHIEKGEFQAIIQDTRKSEFRVTILKYNYVLISMLFKDGIIMRERSMEHNGVKVPIEAISMLKRSTKLMRTMFPEFKYLKMSEIDSFVN